MEIASLPGSATLLPSAAHWTLHLPRGRRLILGGGRPPLVMGILNLTPDSFSDGGRYSDPAIAVDRALAMLAEGADLIDLGAESTRPGGGTYGTGARSVPPAEELARLLPVLEPLRRATDAPLSVDTRKAAVAHAALAAGADLVNDVAALGDPEMGAVVAAAGCPLVLMHSRGDISTMQRGIAFHHLIEEVRAELDAAIGRATAAGVERDQLILDPGLGFGKTTEQNLALLRHLPQLAAAGRPLLVGASRKSFLAATLATAAPAVTDHGAAPAAANSGTGHGAAPAAPAAGTAVLPPGDRLPASLAALAWAAAAGAAIVRVHDVVETVRFLAVDRAIAEARA
jgi:dihydropteroate synthase